MPPATDRLTKFLRLDTSDKIMFGFVQGMQRALPGVGVEKALLLFAKWYGIDGPGFNLNSQRIRYNRMLRDFYQDKKTKTEAHAPQEG